MPHAKQASKRKRRTALPAIGIAGASLALSGGGASAAVRPEPNIPSWGTGPLHEITLGEEEISDVSLATFYVFDHASRESIQGNIQLARGCGGGCGHGCGRCGGGGRCGGIGRCGGGCHFGGCRGCRCGGRCGGGCFGIGIGCGGGWGCSCSCCWSWGFCRLC